MSRKTAQNIDILQKLDTAAVGCRIIITVYTANKTRVDQKSRRPFLLNITLIYRVSDKDWNKVTALFDTKIMLNCYVLHFN